MNPAPSGRVRAASSAASLYGLYLASFLACMLGNLAIRLGQRGGWLPPTARATLAVLAAVPLVVSAALFWRLLRRDLDEMLQRIVLEGLAFALIVYVPLAALYMNLRSAGVGPFRIDLIDILMLPAVLVAIGILLAGRRYR